MGDEIGTSTKLGHLLPLDRMKDSKGKASDQEVFLRKRKKRKAENVSEENEPDGTLLGEGEEPSSGKILDIVI